MKKITLLVFAFFVLWDVNAQISVNEGFEGATTPTGWTYVSFSRSTATPCVGIASVRRNFWASGTAGSVTTNNYVAASNGQQIDVSFDWKSIEFSVGSGVGVSMDIQYSTNNGGTWTTMGNVSTSAITACATWTGSIPAGTVTAGSDFKLKFNGTRTGGDCYFYIDKVIVFQPSLTLPSCASSLIPADLATGIQRNPILSWTAATGGPTSYDVYFGTSPTPGLVSNVTATSYTPTAPLLATTTYYWKIVAKNGNGPAVGCVTQSFTTGALVAYCVPTITFGCTDGDVIARVTLNTLDNDSGTGCPSGVAGYSDYTSDPNPLFTTTLQAGGSYGCTVYAGQYTEGYAAWIDYNDDGTFNNSTERIGFSSGQVAGSGSVGVLGASATFPIVLACNPSLGQHRLRVRAMYNTNGSAVTPCTDNSFGEIEDYTITISAAVACPQPSALTATNITAYTAVLNWNAGCAETSWDLYFGLAGGPAPVVPTAFGVTSPYSVAGLLPETAYEFYVRADCAANGTSLWTGPFTFTTLPIAPNCAVLTTPTNGAIAVPVVGGAITLAWNAPVAGGTPTGYNIYFGTNPLALALLGNTPNLTVDITGVNYATTYYWQAVPVNAGGAAVGCTTFSFTTENTPLPPANDDCAGAIVLTPGSIFGDYPVIGTNISATDTAGVADPLCSSYLGGDVWYSAVVPASGTLTFESDTDDGTITDTGIEVFSGDCATLTSFDCDDDSGNGFFSKLSLTGLTPGDILYLRIFSYDNSEIGTFTVSAYDASLSTASFDIDKFSAYPNPVEDILNLSYAKNISSLSVHNLLGQVVLTKTINAPQSQIDFSTLSAGTYLLRINAGGMINTIKIIKK